MEWIAGSGMLLLIVGIVFCLLRERKDTKEQEQRAAERQPGIRTRGLVEHECYYCGAVFYSNPGGETTSEMKLTEKCPGCTDFLKMMH